MRLLAPFLHLILPLTLLAGEEHAFELRAVAEPTSVTAKRLPFPKHIAREDSLRVENAILLDSSAIESASVEEEGNGPLVLVKLTAPGAARLSEITTKMAGKQIAIIIDGQIENAPWINEPILTSSFYITGPMSGDQAAELSEKLNHLRKPPERG